MVSNALHMDLEELLETLRRLKQKYADDPDYQKIRRDLPEDWPI